MTREKKYKKELISNKIIPYPKSRLKQIKMNGYSTQMETLKGDAKALFIDLKGYININSESPQSYAADLRRTKGNIKHKSYELCTKIFPTMILGSFLFDFDTSETTPSRMYNTSNYFDISMVIRFPHQIDVKEKGNIDLETFSSELLHFMNQRYIISPFSPKKLRELEMSYEIERISDDIDLDDYSYQKEIIEL